ncbi:MAG: hypothetical protein ABI885_24205 [Gammaproteobacteria bacterium]
MRLTLDASRSDGILAGALEGQRFFADLVSRTVVPTSPEICFLDFNDATVATGSFLRESIVAYRNHARAHWPMLYPVAANMNPRVREEFESWLSDRSDAYFACDLDSENRLSNVSILGVIDGKQRLAFKGVVELGETDAPGLAKYVPEEVTPSAWNNRLNALVAKGLIIEVTSGRNKRFRPTLEGLKYGT